MKWCRFLLVLCLCIYKNALAEEASEPATGEEQDSAVVALTDKTFDKFIEENEVALVEFYAPWCGHCKRLAPVYEEVAKHLREQKSSIKLAKVDATAESKTADKFGVGGYPTLKFFQKGKHQDYDGGRSKEQMLDWLEAMSGPAIVDVEDKTAADKMIQKPTKTYFVGSFSSKDSAAYAAFAAVAGSNRQAGQFVAYVESGAPEKITVHRKGEAHAASIDAPSKEEVLQKFVQEEVLPWFGEISQSNYMQYTQSPLDLVWFIGTRAERESAAEILRLAGKALRGSAHVASLDTEEFQGFAERAFGVKETPALLVQRKKDKGTYIFQGKIASAEAVQSYVKDVQAGKVERTIKSDPVPETNDEPVKVVVGKTFEEIVLNKHKDVLIEIYAPWCGHCKRLEPIYQDFAERVQKSKNLVIAKMDGTSNEIPVAGFDTTGFPTVFFVPAGEKTPMNFNGDRTVDAFIKFIKEHAKHPVEVEEKPKKDEEEEEKGAKDEL